MSPPPARVDELKKRYEENPRRFFAPLANEYRKAGDLEAAIDLCRMHLEEQPGHLSGHIVYGQALYEAGHAADARKTFEAALQLDPENLIALRHLGDISAADGDATAAAQWYQRVLEADPRNDEVIALIAGLQAPAAPSLLDQSDATPPPAPQYAEQAAADSSFDLGFIEPSAPTPIIPMEAIAPSAAPAAPEPEPMELVQPVAEAPPAPPAPAAPPADTAPRASIGLMDLDLSLGEETSAAGTDLLADVPGVSVQPLTPAAPAIEEPAPEFTDSGLTFIDLDTGPVVEDTSFGEPVEVAPDSTFGTAAEESTFGDSLDVTAAETFELPTSTDAPAAAEPAVAEGAETEAPASEPAAERVAAPAAPTAGDFDMLFGNAPIADVQIGGGDEATIATADEGFQADSYVGRELTEEAMESPHEIGATPPPFVTETMAELYLQQGFRDEALGVYRQLLAQNPEDTGLAERIRHLEHGSRSSMAIDSVSEKIEAEAIEIERKSAELAAIPAEPEPAVPAAPVGPTAREVFARIAARRAAPAAPAAEPVAEPSAVPAPLPAADQAWGGVMPQDSEPAPIAAVSSGGVIDSLFGYGGVTTDDESAATTMAQAFGSAPGPSVQQSIQGQPTIQGTDELSLNSVFGDEMSRPAPQVLRQSTKLRFDQFFSESGGADSAPSAPPATEPGKGPDDIAQFSDWLKGLKGS
jgi:tetratricopeptide (TPR) repeat protein